MRRHVGDWRHHLRSLLMLVGLCIHSDLRIVFFHSNRMSNRIGRRLYHANRNSLTDCRRTVQPVTGLAYNMLTTSICDRVWRTRVMYGLRNSELSTCLFQFSHKTRQTMLLYAYFTPKVDFKRKFNHHKSFLYEWRLTARTIRKFRIGPSIRIESRIGRTIRNRIELRSFAGPYLCMDGLSLWFSGNGGFL